MRANPRTPRITRTARIVVAVVLVLAVTTAAHVVTAPAAHADPLPEGCTVLAGGEPTEGPDQILCTQGVPWGLIEGLGGDDTFTVLASGTVGNRGILRGGPGNDTFIVEGNYYSGEIWGEDGNDLVQFQPTAPDDAFNLGFVALGSGVDVLTTVGGQNRGRIRGDEDADMIMLNVFAGNDYSGTIEGSSGDDTIVVHTNNGNIYGGDGGDVCQQVDGTGNRYECEAGI